MENEKKKKGEKKKQEGEDKKAVVYSVSLSWSKNFSLGPWITKAGNFPSCSGPHCFPLYLLLLYWGLKKKTNSDVESY